MPNRPRMWQWILRMSLVVDKEVEEAATGETAAIDGNKNLRQISMLVSAKSESRQQNLAYARDHRIGGFPCRSR
jgi:hypothetical protein